jgi:hypothetical protein
MAGALLARLDEGDAARWYLLGDTKGPCDWAAEGFAEPAGWRARDPRQLEPVALQPQGAPALRGTTLRVRGGDAQLAALARRLAVPRTGATSERLWRLAVGDDEADTPTGQALEGSWIAEMPDAAWELLRAAVLRCS